MKMSVPGPLPVMVPPRLQERFLGELARALAGDRSHMATAHGVDGIKVAPAEPRLPLVESMFSPAGSMS